MSHKSWTISIADNLSGNKASNDKRSDEYFQTDDNVKQIEIRVLMKSTSNRESNQSDSSLELQSKKSYVRLIKQKSIELLLV